MERKRLDEILVGQGILSLRTAQRVMMRAKLMDRKFAQVLEEMELVTGEELADALAIRYGCKVAHNLSAMSIAPELLKLVPFEMAMEYLILPLKKEGDLLAMAMAQPEESGKVVSNLAANNGLRIVPYVASKNGLHAGICKQYLGRLPSASQQRTVLVVEDDNLIQAMFEEILTKHGYRVVAAADGVEAFKAVIAEQPQVIITDKEMPKLGGYELLQALLNVPETSCIPVILVTGSALNAEEEAKAFNKGFFDFIVKPVPEITLVSRVKRAFQFYDHHYRLFSAA